MYSPLFSFTFFVLFLIPQSEGKKTYDAAENMASK